jgi:hypothetical protein
MVAVFCSSVQLIKIYAVKDLIDSKKTGGPIALRSIVTGSALLDLAWCPEVGAGHVSTDLIAVLSSGNILAIELNKVGSEGGGRMVAEEAFPPSTCVSWHPSGVIVACGHGDVVTFCVWSASESKWRSVARVKVSSQDVSEGGDLADLAVEALVWVAPTCLLVSSRLVEDGELTDTSLTCAFYWSSPLHQRLVADPLPDGKDISPDAVELFPSYLSQASEAAQPMNMVAGYHLSCVRVDEWSISLFAHVLSSDDHLKLVQVGYSQRIASPKGVTVSDDRLALRIPNATGDEDNFIVGLGVDQTEVLAFSAGGEPHPIDQTAANLPGQPVLWILTSDNVMRAYIFGQINSAGSFPTAIKPPLQVPEPGIASVTVTPKADQGSGDIQAVAASTSLPDEESEIEEEESLVKEDRSKPIIPSPIPKPPLGEGLAKPAGRPAEGKLEEKKLSVSQQKMAPTTVPAPVLQLQTTVGLKLDGKSDLSEVDEALLKEMASIERDFASSLEESRTLEASIHDGLKSIAGGWHVNIGTIRTRINSLSDQLQIVKSELAEDKAAVSDDGSLSVQGLKEIYVRLDAMPGFKHPLQSQVQRALDLERHKPLDPFLSAVKEESQAQVKVLVRKIAEVKECLAVLEDALNAHRLSKFGHTRTQYRWREGDKAKAVYEAIQSQTTLIGRLTQQLDGMKARCDSLLPSYLTEPTSLKVLQGDSLPARHGPDSPLLHVDSHLARPKWTSAKKVAADQSPSPPRAMPASSETCYATDSNLKPSPINGSLQERILKACRSVDGGIRVTRLPTALPPSPWRSDDALKKSSSSPLRSPVARRLPPLSPFKLPDIPPPPYFPSPPPKPTLSKPAPVVQKPAISAKESIPKSVTATKSPNVGKETQPPLPTMSQMKAANALGARALASQPTGQKGAQPPLPTKSQTEAAKSLMTKANVPVQVAPSSSFPLAGKQLSSASASASGLTPVLPSTSSAAFGLSSFGASSASSTASTSAPSSLGFESTAATPAPFGIGKVETAMPASAASTSAISIGTSAGPQAPFGSFGSSASTASASASPFGKSNGFDQPSAFGQPASAPSASASPFGQSSGFGQPSAFGSFGSSASTASASASPFGQSSGFGQPSAFGSFGSSASTASASASPFGQSSGFGQPSAFGSFGSSASTASASSSPFGQSSGFGQPSAFGSFGSSASTASASASPFGQSSGFGQPSAFGQAATPQTPFGQASSDKRGFGSFASTQPSGFSAIAGQGGGFGAIGAGPQSTTTSFGALAGSPPPAKPPSSAMWQPRK